MGSFYSSLVNTVSEVVALNEAHVPDRPRRSRLRLLCLHGHGSNSDITEMQLTSLQLQDVHGVSCDRLEAELTHAASNATLAQLSERPFRTWFHWTKSSADSFTTTNLEESLERIMAAVSKYGPYDGIYGFSQGAFMCSVVCNPAVWRGRFGLDRCPFDFAILANAGLSDSLRSCKVAQARASGGEPEAALELPLTIPSLHLIGALDPYYRSQKSLASDLYTYAHTHVHAEGHELPLKLVQDVQLTEALAGFLKPFAESKRLHADEHIF